MSVVTRCGVPACECAVVRRGEDVAALRRERAHGRCVERWKHNGNMFSILFAPFDELAICRTGEISVPDHAHGPHVVLMLLQHFQQLPLHFFLFFPHFDQFVAAAGNDTPFIVCGKTKNLAIVSTELCRWSHGGTDCT